MDIKDLLKEKKQYVGKEIEIYETCDKFFDTILRGIKKN